MDILELSALELGKKIKSKEIGVVEATKAVLENIENKESDYHCYVTVCKKEALQQAEEVQKKIDSGEYQSPLAGVPAAVKDNMCTKGIQTSCSSRMLETFKPIYTATAVQKLQNAGAVILGKTNMDEFAMGSTSETSYFGITKNPWNTEHVPGGSSGGSAAAVAAKEAFYTLGSDTGGSIRQPASYCGITGLKPTYGTVSRYGLIAYASSLDQIGPMAKSVEDTAEIYKIIAGHDKKDSTSVNHPSPEFTLCEDMKGKKIGIPVEFFGEGIDADVKEAIYKAAKVYESLGAEVEEISMSAIKYAIPAYYIAACAEASSNLSRYDGIKYGHCAEKYDDLVDLYYQSRSEGFGSEVKKRILIGAFVLSSGYYDAYYNKALQVKALIKQSYDDAFGKYDFLLTPTAPTTAPKIGESFKDTLKMYLSDICTVSVNLAGLPGLVVPCGLDKTGLPIGLQLIGKAFSEETLLNAGFAFQKATDFHTMSPEMNQ